MAKRTNEEAIQELWYWLYGTSPSNFSSVLFSLISKADIENRARLQGAFPMEFNAWMLWQANENEIEFFKKWGVEVSGRPVRRTADELYCLIDCPHCKVARTLVAAKDPI
jgi:hypothetical protein